MEKMLITSVFAISHEFSTLPKKYCINSLPHKFNFNDPENNHIQKTSWEKEKLLVTSIFSFSQNVFYSFQRKFQILSRIYFDVCKCFQFGFGQVFVVWQRVVPDLNFGQQMPSTWTRLHFSHVVKS